MAPDTYGYYPAENNEKRCNLGKMVANCKMISFHTFGGEAGNLNAIEGSADLPFPSRRVYYITRVPEGVTRGFHSHKRLEQVLLCVNGSVSIRIKTPFEEEVIPLNDPARGLYIGHMVWREMFDFSPGAVLLVLASEHYTEDDYIRNYSCYMQEAIPYFEKEQV